MAANFYFVFVKNQESTEIDKILPKIGFDGFEPEKEVDLWDTSKPNTLFAGKHNGYLILADEELSFEFLQEEPSETELDFINIFSNTEIAAFVLNESVGMFGYAIIENGIRKRIKFGTDGTIELDFGEELSIELELLNDTIFEPEELEEMEENGEDIEALVEFEASYRATGKLISERLGKDFYTLKDGEVKVTRYQ